MTDTRCCIVCGGAADDPDLDDLCPLNDEDDPGDDWENDHCLALDVWVEQAAARHDPNAPRPAWVDALEAAFERANPPS